MKFATLLTPSSVYMSRTPFSKVPQWAQLSPDGGSIRATDTHTRHNDDGMMILIMMLMIITGTDICKYI